MKCNVCGFTSDKENIKYCSNCGSKIKNIQNEEIFLKELDVNKKGTPFLVMGIIMAFCCSLPFGAAVIILNELKYKEAIKKGNLKEADKIKTIMIIMLCIGLFVGILGTTIRLIIDMSDIFA